MSSRQPSIARSRAGFARGSPEARAEARERSNANLRHGRANRFMENMTVSMSTIPEIDAVRLSTPMMTHFHGSRCIGIAPGDSLVCVLCGLYFKSGTQYDLHRPKCAGCPNPNRFEGDGVRHFTITEISDYLAGKDSQRDSGHVYNQYSNNAGVEVEQLNNKAIGLIAKQEAEIAKKHINNWHPGNHAALTYSVPNPHVETLIGLSQRNSCGPPPPPAHIPRNIDSMFQAVIGHPTVTMEQRSTSLQPNASLQLASCVNSATLPSEEEPPEEETKETAAAAVFEAEDAKPAAISRATLGAQFDDAIDDALLAQEEVEVEDDDVEVLSPVNPPAARARKMVSVRMLSNFASDQRKA